MIKAIDLFAGFGGTTTGAHQTGRIQVVYAANHWPVAVATHAANHPATRHECQDLHQVDFTKVPACDLLLASPACTGHTKARGIDRPHHDASRATAWAVVSGVEALRPTAFCVENVTEFQAWALFPVWLDALGRLGYNLTTVTLNAADFGVPQSRERVFVLGHRSKAFSIVSPGLPHGPARAIIDLNAGQWRPIHDRPRPLVAKTLARIARGRAVYGADFLLAYYGNEQGGRSLDRPLGTIATVDTFAVVRGDHMRMVTDDEYRRGMAFPDGYLLPPRHRDVVRGLGGAVPPGLARGVLSQVADQMQGAA